MNKWGYNKSTLLVENVRKNILTVKILHALLIFNAYIICEMSLPFVKFILKSGKRRNNLVNDYGEV